MIRHDGGDETACGAYNAAGGMVRLARCSNKTAAFAPRSRRTWLLLLVVVGVLASAGRAFAWGPGTHVEIADAVLGQIALLPAAIAALLARYTTAYIYGNVAADVVFAKRLSRVRQFCHHWSTGFKLLEKAESDEAKAFAYGYLSHLAADTVAHGKYVPRQITLARSTMNFGHFYWELRADALARSEAWSRLRQVFDEDHQRHHDVLSVHLRGTFLPYAVNRRLFERLSRTAMHPLHQRTVETVADFSRYPLSAQELDSYRAECVDRTMSLLEHGPRGVLMREDPNGTAALLHTRLLKRDLRRMERRGQTTLAMAREMTVALAPMANGCPAWPDVRERARASEEASLV